MADAAGCRKRFTAKRQATGMKVPDETRMFVYDGWNLIKEIVTDGDT